MSFLLVGQGKVGTHFQVYLDQAKLPFAVWNRKTHSMGDLANKISSASHILLAITDSALEGFFQEHRPNGPEKMWIHFSGALEIAGMHSVHPLMTFGPLLHSLDKYKSIPFVTTSSLPLSKLLPGFENRLYRISLEHKARYHAFCVLAGNFTTILWQKFLFEIEKMGLPTEVARPFAEQTIRNVLDFPDTALTGPIARNDHRLQRMNLAALRGDRFAEVYEAFQFANVQLVEERQKLRDHQSHTKKEKGS